MKKYDDKGHSLQASLYYSSRKDEEETEEEYVTETRCQLYSHRFGTDPDTVTDKPAWIQSFVQNSIIYVPSASGKLEAGLQSRWEKQEGNYIFEDFQPAGEEWLVNDSISIWNTRMHCNRFMACIRHRLGKFEYQLGLRAEYDHRSLDQKTSSESYTYEKIHFFPSFYILRKLSDAHQFQFTYSNPDSASQLMEPESFQGV